MSVLSWNCRGLGSKPTVRELLSLVTKQLPMFVFISETKSIKAAVERVRIRMGFEGLFVVDKVGRGGGLALFWRERDMATLLGYSGNHIDVLVNLPGQEPWRLTCFYGFPDQVDRHLSWDLLRDLKVRSRLPWAVIRDFNDLASHTEKWGGSVHSDRLIRGFNAALRDCGLNDMGMEGHEFTWEKGKGTERWVQERLDRAVATTEWCAMFSEAIVRNLITINSDHSAIILDLVVRPIRQVIRRFKFESGWLLDGECRQVVEQSWAMTRGRTFMQRIQQCGVDLFRWGGDYFVKFGWRIQRLRAKLERLRSSRVQHDVNLYVRLEKELSGLLAQEEVYWR
ncbi:PREDICTED: uncharacterized protein LOC109179063 [Ipomoea nil]|uniref:uncharacterized protein LOC109179063 n=1 Tax=Ipomoea nil TaxID=35883 RepID=UPI000901F73A|nr:PREDICTED: uncharacterized protein LOC109179063 [Ipomoea nil]